MHSKMDINILRTLDIQELIVVESRLKSSIINLNQLISELYGENCRISQHNLELKRLKNRFPNATEKIGNLFKCAIFSQFNSSEKITPKQFDCNPKENCYESRYEIDTFKRNSATKLQETNSTQMSTAVDTNNDSILSKDIDRSKLTTCVQQIGASICYDEPNSNKNDTNSEHLQNCRRKTTITGNENMTQYEIDMLVDENSYVEIKFPSFENDQSRENFTKEIIKSIGLKPIYFDCIKSILRDIESGRKCVDNMIDIANLDPWGNNNDEIFLKNQSKV